MHVDLDIPVSEFENDLLDAVEYISGLRVKHNDGRYLATLRLLKEIAQQYKFAYWKPVYAVVPRKPERHEKACDCGECFPSFFGRIYYRGSVYSLHGALAVSSMKELAERLASKRPIISFYGETEKNVLAEVQMYCEKKRLFLYNPLTGTEQVL